MQKKGQVRTWEKAREPGALTFWRARREGQVKMQKESEGARNTHELENEKGGTIQSKKTKRPSKGHSQTRERGVMTKEK
jgi:hypothetical protein